MTTNDAPKPAPAYEWTPPPYVVGQRLRFWYRDGVSLAGVLSSVETHYYDGKASHTYVICPDGHRRFSWVGINGIIGADERKTA